MLDSSCYSKKFVQAIAVLSSVALCIMIEYLLIPIGSVIQHGAAQAQSLMSSPVYSFLANFCPTSLFPTTCAA